MRVNFLQKIINKGHWNVSDTSCASHKKCRTRALKQKLTPMEFIPRHGGRRPTFKEWDAGHRGTE